MTTTHTLNIGGCELEVTGEVYEDFSELVSVKLRGLEILKRLSANSVEELAVLHFKATCRESYENKLEAREASKENL